MVFKAFPDAAEEFDENVPPLTYSKAAGLHRSPLSSCIKWAVSDATILDVLHQFPRAAVAHPFIPTEKKQQHMLCFSVERGVSDTVAEALRVEALAHVSRTFSEHRTLDPCVFPVPLGTAVSLNFETAHAVLAEGGGSPVSVRLLRAWHHGEALHAAFRKLSLTKVCPPDAAQCVIAVLYGQCRGTACSCHCVVSRWKRLISVT